jgi:two-component system phosphate regulon sensor histidine kinase PhoR
LIARGVTALLLVLAALLLLLRAFRHKSANILVASEAEERNENTSDEIFALGKLFEATTGGMREGLLVVDRDLRVVASNPAAHRLFNLSEKDPASQRLTELTRNRAIYGAFLDALKGKERSGVKVETHSPERRIFDLRVVPLGGADGKVTEGAIGIFFDVTRLERLERVRQEFLSNVSHELRTPLTAIDGWLHILLGGEPGPLTPEQRSFLTTVKQHSDRLIQLVSDLLLIGQIDVGPLIVDPADVDVADLARDIAALFAAEAAANGVAVTVAADSPVIVCAERLRLRQLLGNLMSNAVKFTLPGGTVSVRVTAGDEFCVIEVADTGIGIPQAERDQLFERFYRGATAREHRVTGTGLGLAVCKAVVQAHHGSIRLAATDGPGCTFIVELPLAARQEARL